MTVCFTTSNQSMIDLILKDVISMLPKVDAIEDLFKAWFRMNKSTYTNSMKSARILTIDHTFKVSVLETSEIFISISKKYLGLLRPTESYHSSWSNFFSVFSILL